ncbi:MAG TPA: pentapeptide repeat-containing protein [Natronosporangium sp.]
MIVTPDLPAELEPATVDEHDLADEALFRGVSFEIDLPDREAELVEFEGCRFHRADLSGTALTKARFTDCVFDHANLANLHADKSAMWRVRLTSCRLTGLQWGGGTLREVTVAQCRADLAGFRFSGFKHVRFEECNLARADFQDADLTGAEFHDCDLTGAQFSRAKLTGARFRNCELAGLGGITSLAGAILAGQDLVALSYTLAAGLGIRLEDPTD